MKKTKNSPDKLKQTKITAFCSGLGTKSENFTSVLNRKRKNTADVSHIHKTPNKRVAKTDTRSPDILRTPSENNLIAENDFEDFAFDDFENEPFISPRKKESPKKNILTESLSGNGNFEEVKSEISFETPVKCKVVKKLHLKEKHFELVLHLIDVVTSKTGICKLREVWASSQVSVDDVVCVQAFFSEGHWLVDNKNGFLILHPDILITSTNLTQSMFCLRQGLLCKIYQDAPFENNSKMLIGRLVHELFQESLKNQCGSDEEFHKMIARFMESRENLLEFFFSDISVSEIETEMKNFIPHVRKFLDVYVNKRNVPTGKNFSGSIENVIDIEEVVKSRTLGFQGRIDVTVNLRSKKTEKIAPLELKTGRASFSQEHRSQLILYILLMNELGRKVDSGLLLYLREDVLEEILPQRDDIRNMFLLRNRFVEFFKSLASGSLPEPIYNIRGCAKCSYLRICTTYLKKGDFEVSQGHPLRNVEIPDLKPSHVDYFVRWSKMLWMEYEDILKEFKEDLEIPNLTLELNIEEFKDGFKCNFRKSCDFKSSRIQSGVYVRILDDKNSPKCTGQILEISDSLISVLTNIKLAEFSQFYKIVPFKSNFFSFYLCNLGWLLNEEFESLRELIIDKRAPDFDKNLVKADFEEKCLKNLLSLNKEQQKAILKSLLCQNYLLIKGPPGTGKTQTIVSLIKILLALDKTVLIAGHTHSSVDNILLRLEGIEYLRLGSLKNIKKEIHKNSYNFLVENCSTVDDIKKLFDRKLIAATCMGIDTDFIRKMKFDYCIVDESSQVLQPEILRPLFCCKKFILVGDEDQLGPIVRNPEAKKLGMGKSLFESLSNDLLTIKLKLQYRMNSIINKLANKLTYKGLIECGNEEVAKATMRIPNRDIYLQEDEWVVEILSNDLEKSVVFIDTSEYFQLNNKVTGKQRSSVIEANIVLKLVSCLMKIGLKEESIGVITPFWDQISLLMKKLREKNLEKIELSTVDKFQGRDKEVILFSCGKEYKPNEEVTESELLNDVRRLTVVVTRAKHKLIIIANKEIINKYKPFENLVKSMNESQFFCLSDDFPGEGLIHKVIETMEKILLRLIYF